MKYHNIYVCMFVCRQQQMAVASASLDTPKKSSNKTSPSLQNYGKLVLCKRVCQRVEEIGDPIQLRLLYAQAVHYVVHVSIWAPSYPCRCTCQFKTNDIKSTRQKKFLIIGFNTKTVNNIIIIHYTV